MHDSDQLESNQETLVTRSRTGNTPLHRGSAATKSETSGAFLNQPVRLRQVPGHPGNLARPLVLGGKCKTEPASDETVTSPTSRSAPMSDDDLKRELAELRQKIEKLTAARASARPTSAAPGSPKRAHARSLLGELEELTSDFDPKSIDLEPITDRISALLRGLSTDMKNSEPRALLTSFLAGVLVGKLMSR